MACGHDLTITTANVIKESKRVEKVAPLFTCLKVLHEACLSSRDAFVPDLSREKEEGKESFLKFLTQKETVNNT